ncbi:MaoC family dehydratase, partial [Streptomyces sp. ISL-11]|uniref:MaoC family dehydratase n=1 Tax=Streptomyces sp. ISL-11 TaxID=2819174 RepID=UPI001BE8F139
MAEPRIFTSPEELRAAVGEELGPGDWLEVDQKRIDLFAEATGDHQWIHVDAERAAAGPFGTTIAHGYLTLSLLAALVPPLMRAEGARMGINYGLNKVRFPAPVPAGSRLRARAR